MQSLGDSTPAWKGLVATKPPSSLSGGAGHPGGLKGQSLWFSLSGKPGDHDAPENGADSFESSESLLQSWTSQSSLLDVQRVPSFESFEDDCSQSLCLNKPTMSFKDYIQERSDPVEQGKPVIPAAVLAGFTGEHAAPGPRPLPAPAQPHALCTQGDARCSLAHLALFPLVVCVGLRS